MTGPGITPTGRGGAWGGGPPLNVEEEEGIMLGRVLSTFGMIGLDAILSKDE